MNRQTATWAIIAWDSDPQLGPVSPEYQRSRRDLRQSPSDHTTRYFVLSSRHDFTADRYPASTIQGVYDREFALMNRPAKNCPPGTSASLGLRTPNVDNIKDQVFATTGQSASYIIAIISPYLTLINIQRYNLR